MYSIRNDMINELIINKSKFIAIAIKIRNKDLIKNKLAEIKDKYKDATHYCYAVKINEYTKVSDDGEPSGTAGIPIMEIINKRNLNYILIVVVRYFGGIKLGAGGLIRAYAKASCNVLDIAKITRIVNGYNITVIVPYSEKKNIENILNTSQYKKKFLENIIYDIDITDYDTIKLIEHKYKIINKNMIECEEDINSK